MNYLIVFSFPDAISPLKKLVPVLVLLYSEEVLFSLETEELSSGILNVAMCLQFFLNFLCSNLQQLVHSCIFGTLDHLQHSIHESNIRKICIEKPSNHKRNTCIDRFARL